jgi:hypothetical protein
MKRDESVELFAVEKGEDVRKRVRWHKKRERDGTNNNTTQRRKKINGLSSLQNKKGNRQQCHD